MSTDTNSISIWAKELSSHLFIERIVESKCEELWTYLPKSRAFRIPAHSQWVFHNKIYSQKRNIKK
jgi:hypothetical protein